MGKRVMALTAGLLCLCLAGCGGRASKTPFVPETAARTLLDTPGVFTEELERLDEAVVAGEYGLEEQGVAEVVSYYSPGGTAEEVTLVAFEDPSLAEAFVDTALSHIEDQKEANVTYRPDEMPKLDKAVVERRESTVMVLVCADYEAALAALN